MAFHQGCYLLINVFFVWLATHNPAHLTGLENNHLKPWKKRIQLTANLKLTYGFCYCSLAIVLATIWLSQNTNNNQLVVW